MLCYSDTWLDCKTLAQSVVFEGHSLTNHWTRDKPDWQTVPIDQCESLKWHNLETEPWNIAERQVVGEWTTSLAVLFPCYNIIKWPRLPTLPMQYSVLSFMWLGCASLGHPSFLIHCHQNCVPTTVEPTALCVLILMTFLFPCISQHTPAAGQFVSHRCDSL